MDIVKGNMGWIEVVVGPMFSGKSEELIRRLLSLIHILRSIDSMRWRRA